MSKSSSDPFTRLSSSQLSSIIDEESSKLLLFHVIKASLSNLLYSFSLLPSKSFRHSKYCGVNIPVLIVSPTSFHDVLYVDSWFQGLNSLISSDELFSARFSLFKAEKGSEKVNLDNLTDSFCFQVQKGGPETEQATFSQIQPLIAKFFSDFHEKLQQSKAVSMALNNKTKANLHYQFSLLSQTEKKKPTAPPSEIFHLASEAELNRCQSLQDEEKHLESNYLSTGPYSLFFTGFKSDESLELSQLEISSQESYMDTFDKIRNSSAADSKEGKEAANDLLFQIHHGTAVAPANSPLLASSCSTRAALTLKTHQEFVEFAEYVVKFNATQVKKLEKQFKNKLNNAKIKGFLSKLKSIGAVTMKGRSNVLTNAAQEIIKDKELLKETAEKEEDEDEAEYPANFAANRKKNAKAQHTEAERKENEAETFDTIAVQEEQSVAVKNTVIDPFDFDSENSVASLCSSVTKSGVPIAAKWPDAAAKATWSVSSSVKAVAASTAAAEDSEDEKLLTPTTNATITKAVAQCQRRVIASKPLLVDPYSDFEVAQHSTGHKSLQKTLLEKSAVVEQREEPENSPCSIRSKRSQNSKRAARIEESISSSSDEQVSSSFDPARRQEIIEAEVRETLAEQRAKQLQDCSSDDELLLSPRSQSIELQQMVASAERKKRESESLSQSQNLFIPADPKADVKESTQLLEEIIISASQSQ
jgi:hypothetical protein